MSSRAPSSLSSVRALVFDLMGTCVDWHASLAPLLPPGTPASLLADWRQGFFAETHALFAAGAPPEDIDATHRRVLDRLLDQHGWGVEQGWTEPKRRELVRAWHVQEGALLALQHPSSSIYICIDRLARRA
jgi:FMN phosphatase YigB (HAD superfamily)